MRNVFEDFDVDQFWESSEFALKDYVDAPPSEELVANVERALGYKLPASYIELMQYQNGGIPIKTCHRTSEPTSWASDHIAITGIFSIGSAKSCSLCGSFGSQFYINALRYPAIGVYFADCPSAGHDVVCLDYRDCGPEGEPRVVHVDQEFDYKITFVAENFEAFIRGLKPEEEFGEDA